MAPDFSHNKGNRIKCCSNEFIHCTIHPSLCFLSVSVKRCEKITKEGVDRGVAHSTYYVTKQQPARDIISNAPAINTINRGVFCVYFITS